MGWIIFGSIILLLLIILMIPVHISVSYKDENTVLKIKYLFIEKTVFPSEKKEEKEEPAEKTEEKKPKPKKEKKKLGLVEIVDMITDAVQRYKGGAKMILGNIRIHRFEFFWRITAEDAAACGIKYGRACAGINTAFGFFRNLMKIEHVKMRVFPDFAGEKDEIYGEADAEANPLIVLIGALRIGFAYLGGILGKEKTNDENYKKEQTA